MASEAPAPDRLLAILNRLPALSRVFQLWREAHADDDLESCWRSFAELTVGLLEDLQDTELQRQLMAVRVDALIATGTCTDEERAQLTAWSDNLKAGVN
jgi:lipoprotein NlpI